MKAEVASEALKESGTAKDTAAEYRIYPNMVTKWKKEFVSNRKYGSKEVAVTDTITTTYYKIMVKETIIIYY